MKNEILAFIVLVIVILLVRYSNYTECNPSQTYVSGYRCYAGDKKTFDQHVKKCSDCTKGVWSLF
jgi:hypothetical protein